MINITAEPVGFALNAVSTNSIKKRVCVRLKKMFKYVTISDSSSKTVELAKVNDKKNKSQRRHSTKAKLEKISEKKD